jgi:diguanylate cyclase (GGDEF)-like protein
MQMSETRSKFPEAAHAVRIQDGLRQIERKQWWMWISAFAVSVLLALGVASFAPPAAHFRDAETYAFSLNQSVWALVALVLLFNTYMLYQQIQIARLRGELTDQIESLAKVEHLATEVYKLAALDPLTGLFNRRSGEQRLSEEISRTQRHDRALTILMMDLDSLKQVNDKYGHASGDTMLKAFSGRLTRAVRGSDHAVRLGGDEFMVILPECKPEEVRHVLARLEGLTIQCETDIVPVGFSFGWAEHQSSESADDLIRRADQALYENKRAGKKEARRESTALAV